MPGADRKIRWLAFWSIPLAFGVMGLKFLAWHLTGSVALFSDALESTVNVIAALIAFLAIGYAHRPADENHPFGHHKAEYFSAVIEGVLIVLAALMIVREAVNGLLEPRILTEPAAGLVVNIVAAAINGGWAWLLIRMGRRHRSPALEADGRHIYSDVITSVGVVAGLLLAILFGQPWLDPVLALIVAANIIYEGWRVIGSSVGGLMDSAIDPVEEEQIRNLIRTHANGAIEAHDIRTRRAGRASFVEFHLVVDGNMTVDASHRICDRIEAALKKEVTGIGVIIHVEPAYKAKDQGVLLH